MDACKPGQTNSPGSAGNSRLSRGAIADYRHLEAELQEAHKQKAESIDKMFHLAKEKVMPALTLSNSVALPLKLKLDIKVCNFQNVAKRMLIITSTSIWKNNSWSLKAHTDLCEFSKDL